MFSDYEAGEDQRLLTGENKEILSKQQSSSPRGIFFCLGLVSLTIFAFSLYRPGGFSRQELKLDSEPSSRLFQSCVDNDYVGGSKFYVEDGCVYLFSDNGISGKSSMTSICSCQSESPLLLTQTELEEYGLVVNGKSKLAAVTTGDGVTATVFESSSVSGRKLTIAPGNNKPLNKFLDEKQIPWNDRIKSLSVKSTLAATCEATSKCPSLHDISRESQRVVKGALLHKKEFNLEVANPSAEGAAVNAVSATAIVEKPGFTSCGANVRTGGSATDFLTNDDEIDGCVYLFRDVPSQALQTISSVRFCSCDLYGEIDFNLGAMRRFGLIDGNGNIRLTKPSKSNCSLSLINA